MPRFDCECLNCGTVQEEVLRGGCRPGPCSICGAERRKLFSPPVIRDDNLRGALKHIDARETGLGRGIETRSDLKKLEERGIVVASERDVEYYKRRKDFEGVEVVKQFEGD